MRYLKLMIPAVLASLVLAMLARGVTILSDPPATNVDELACDLLLCLDEMLEFETGEPPYTFDDDDLNKALEKGYDKLVDAREKVIEGKTADALKKMKDAVKHYVEGSEVPVSGNGFADDLAWLTTTIGRYFTERLLFVTPWDEGSEDSSRYKAIEDYEEGVELIGFDANELEKGMSKFQKAAKRAEKNFDYELPICGD